MIEHESLKWSPVTSVGIAANNKDSSKTLGTRVSCKTGTGLGGQRAGQA